MSGRFPTGKRLSHFEVLAKRWQRLVGKVRGRIVLLLCLFSNSRVSFLWLFTRAWANSRLVHGFLSSRPSHPSQADISLRYVGLVGPGVRNTEHCRRCSSSPLVGAGAICAPRLHELECAAGSLNKKSSGKISGFAAATASAAFLSA